MINFELARKEMIELQLKRRGISDTAVLEAFKKIPRHKFVPEDNIDHSYDDSALPIGWGQTISQPYITAFMTQVLHPMKDEVILEIGTGSGFQTAILSTMCKFVVSVEKIGNVASFGRKNLEDNGIKNVQVFVGDGTLGWKSNSPYDAIIVTAGAEKIPQALIDQLKPGGRMVIPVRRDGYHKLNLILKEEKEFRTKELLDCAFVPLIGRGYDKDGTGTGTDKNGVVK